MLTLFSLTHSSNELIIYFNNKSNLKLMKLWSCELSCIQLISWYKISSNQVILLSNKK